MPDNTKNIRRIASFQWEVAQDLHGAVAKSENQNIILPLTVLRRLDYAQTSLNDLELDEGASKFSSSELTVC